VSFPRATAVQIPIEMFDSIDPTSPETGITFVAGDVKIGKDGGALANTTNLPAEASLGVYWLQLTAAEMDATSIIIVVTKAGVASRTSITIGTHGMPAGSVVTGTSATSFVTDRTETAADFWKDCFCTFTSGALAGQTKVIASYNGTTKALGFSSGFTAAPSAGDRFVLIDR
jgi:hypothetical protein